MDSEKGKVTAPGNEHEISATQFLDMDRESGEKSPAPMASGFSSDTSLDHTPLLIGKGKRKIADTNVDINEIETVTPSRQDTEPIGECMPLDRKYAKYSTSLVRESQLHQYGESIFGANKKDITEDFGQEKDAKEEIDGSNNVSVIGGGDGELEEQNDFEASADKLIHSFGYVCEKVNKIIILAEQKGFKPVNERLATLKKVMRNLFADISNNDCTNCLNSKFRFKLVANKLSEVYSLLDYDNELVMILNSFMVPDGFGIGIDKGAAAALGGVAVIIQKMKNGKDFYIQYLKDFGDPMEYDSNGKWSPLRMIIKSSHISKDTGFPWNSMELCHDVTNLLRFRRSESKMAKIIKLQQEKMEQTKKKEVKDEDEEEGGREEGEGE